MRLNIAKEPDGAKRPGCLHLSIQSDGGAVHLEAPFSCFFDGGTRERKRWSSDSRFERSHSE